MAVYCLRNKSGALSIPVLWNELDALTREGPSLPSELLFRRMPMQAFSLAREDLWTLILFHQGRNRETGLYYCKRTLQTPEGRPFRVGENIRHLESLAMLQRRGIVSWFIPQEDPSSGQKHPPIRASLLEPFFQNPTKERWTALRFLVFLAGYSGKALSYRTIRQALSCSTDLARALIQYHRAHLHGRLSPGRIKNRVYNWTRENGKVQLSSVPKTGFETTSLKGKTGVPKRTQTAPNQEKTKPLILAENSPLCTELGSQYNAPKKEEENPSTRPLPAAAEMGSFFDAKEKPKKSPSTSKLSLAELGFQTEETLPLELSDKAEECLAPYAPLFQEIIHHKAATALFELARGKKALQGVGEATLARYVVDVFLEMLRRTKTIRSSPLGYFFSSLRINLALGYCRLDRKQESAEKRMRQVEEEKRETLIRYLAELRDQGFQAIRRESVAKEKGFDSIPFSEFERKEAILRDACANLIDRGDLPPLTAQVYAHSEEVGATREAWIQFLKSNETQVKAEYNAMRRPREAA